jgi:hypothetical protein
VILAEVYEAVAAAGAILSLLEDVKRPVHTLFANFYD